MDLEASFAVQESEEEEEETTIRREWWGRVYPKHVVT